jgi:aspartyl/glutamyl-tRNA(Asn/Gln) amidotransferase C subunit
MSLSREEVQKIANLGRLSLGEAEIEKLGKDLSKMLDYVGTLGELDTSNIEPMVGALEFTHIVRSDEVIATCATERAAMLANAPDSEDSYIKVPKMTKTNPSTKLPDARHASPSERSLHGVNEHREGEHNNADGTLLRGSND